MTTRGDTTYRATDDGAMVEEQQETLYFDDGRALPLIRTRKIASSSIGASTPRAESSDEQSQVERQAVTHAAQLAVEEEKLREQLDSLKKRREETKKKLEESEEQLRALNDPARGHRLQELQMQSSRAEREQFEKSNEASDLKLEAARLLEQAKDKGLIRQAAQAKLDGEDRPELGIVIDGAVTAEQVEQLARVEHLLEDQAATASSKQAVAQAAMHVAEDEYAKAQAEIAKIESDVPAYGLDKVEAMVQMNQNWLQEMDQTVPALETKVKDSHLKAQRAQAAAVELLRSREKRAEASKRALAASNQAKEEEAQEQEAAKQRKQAAEEAESNRQQQAEDRRKQMAGREAELSRRAEEERRALEDQYSSQRTMASLTASHDIVRDETGLTPREEAAAAKRASQQATAAAKPAAATASRQPRQHPSPAPQQQQAVIGKDTAIGVWLRSMRMAQYEDEFEAWGMPTLGKLLDNSQWLTESDLKEMGVVLVHRKSILQCIRAVAAIMSKNSAETPAADARPAAASANKSAEKRKPSGVPLSAGQTAVLEEMFEAYAPTGELSEMGMNSLLLEAMAYPLLSKECLSVTAPHVRRWVRNRELSEGIDLSSNLVLKRIFEFIDAEGTGSISLQSASEGIAQMWGGAADGWSYLYFLTTAGEQLEDSAISEFILSACSFVVELATNVTVLERCHLEANGMPTDRATSKLRELKRELSTSENAVKCHSDAVMRILGRGRVGELPAPYRRLDELIRGILSQDLSVIHAPVINTPATPRGMKLKRPKAPPSSNSGGFSDTVNTMLENRLAEVEKERAARKGQRDQNQRVSSPRCRLMPITVKLRRNTGKRNQKSVEASGITTDQLISDMHKKLGFRFCKLYSLLGVEVDPTSIARPMELVASAGDPFMPIEEPQQPQKVSILQSVALQSSTNSQRVCSSPARTRAGQASPRGRGSQASPARARTPSKTPRAGGAETPRETTTPRRARSPMTRKAPLPKVFGASRGAVEPSQAPPPIPEATSDPNGPSPLAAQVPRSAIRWASAARLQPGEWSDSRNIRRGVTLGRGL